MRIVLDDVVYDLNAAFNDASMSDWRALIIGAKRGSAAVEAGSRAIAGMTDKDELTPEIEQKLIETVTDLIFLARRVAGEKTLKYEAVADSLSYKAVIAAMYAAAQTAESEPDVVADPTRAQTVTEAAGRKQRGKVTRSSTRMT